MKTRTRGKEEKKHYSRVRVLRSSTCVNVIKQLPDGAYDIDIVNLGYKYCQETTNNPYNQKKC